MNRFASEPDSYSGVLPASRLLPSPLHSRVGIRNKEAFYSSFFINPASAAKGLCVALAVFGLLVELSEKYC